MNKTRWIIFSVVTVIILIILVSLSGKSDVDVNKISPNAVQKGSSQNGNIGDHVFGKAGSKVTLIEYADFQCPGCAANHSTTKAITEEYKNELQFVFRNFPLGSIHPNARIAAATAEAAGLQGKYWEMIDLIYQNQSAWANLSGDNLSAVFDKYAKELDLDMTKFHKDQSSKEVAAKINYDQAIGYKIGVEGTPTFVLNGKKLDQTIWANKDKFKEAIDNELKKAGIPLPTTKTE